PAPTPSGHRSRLPAERSARITSLYGKRSPPRQNCPAYIRIDVVVFLVLWHSVLYSGGQTMSIKEDSDFFLNVLNDPVLKKIMKRLSVVQWKPPVKEQPHNSVLKLWKPSWMLPMPHHREVNGNKIEGVNVHYEARCRYELRVEAEIHHYIPSLDKM